MDGSEAHRGVAFGIELTAEESNLLRVEAAGLVLEGIGVEILERSRATTQHQVDLGLHIVGFHAVEPFGVQIDFLVTGEAHHIRKVHLDLQAVGLHCLYTEILGDGAGAHLETSRP